MFIFRMNKYICGCVLVSVCVLIPALYRVSTDHFQIICEENDFNIPK